MKRMLAMLMAVCLLLSVAVFAEDRTQQVLELVKGRLGDTEEYETFYSSNRVSGGETVYYFNWEDNDTETFRYRNLSVTESGIILDYNSYTAGENSRTDKPSLDRLPTEAVQKTAQDFLQKMNPGIAASLVLEPQQNSMSLWSNSYRFTVQRVENGIPVYGDSGNITVSADGKTVTDFYLQYTEGLTFADPAKAISRDAAEKAYAEKLGMELQYLSRYEKKELTVYPAYVAKVQHGTYIDAFTGEAVTPAIVPYGSNDKFFNSTTESTEDASASMGAGLSPAEQQEMENLAGLLTKEQATKLLRENVVLGIGTDMVEVNSGLNKQYRGERYLYNFRYKSPTQTVSVTMDAKTGQIYSVNRYGELTGTEITEDAAKKLAQDVAGKLAGEYLNEYRLNDDGCSYTRYANNVPFYDDSISVEIDQKSGLLTWFSLQYSDVEFPSVEGVLTPAQAAEKMFSQTAYELRYVRDYVSEASKTFDKATLVYMFTEGVGELDPFTGKMKKYEAAEIPEYTDIAGHYAEEAITVLRKFGVGFASGEFKPNATITQGEFLELLRVVFYGLNTAVLTEEYDYADAKRTAVNEGIVPADADLSLPLSRETAAVMLVKAMGFDTVASLQGIYNCPFADVTAHMGHVSILGAMGVFKGDGNGNFLPEKLLTRADAAVVLYNYLKA